MSAKYFFLFLFLSFLSSAILTVVSLAYEQRILRIDFEAVMYGFPFPWLERVLCTFAGRTDFFIFKLSNLAVDMILYLLPSLVFWSVILLFIEYRTSKSSVGIDN